MEKLSKEPYDKKYLNFFRELISTQSSVRQEELETTLLQDDNEVEYAIQNTLTNETTHLLFSLDVIDKDCFEHEAVENAKEIGINESYEPKEEEKLFDAVEAYAQWLETKGYRFVYWTVHSCSIWGVVVPKERVDALLSLAKEVEFLMVPLLLAPERPDWIETLKAKRVQNGEIYVEENFYETLQTYAKKAQEMGRSLYLYIGMEGCGTCAMLENSLNYPEMQRLFQDAFLLKIDIVPFLATLRTVFVDTTSAPTFFYITPEGKLTNHTIGGYAWEKDTIENKVSALTPYLEDKNHKPRVLDETFAKEMILNVILLYPKLSTVKQMIEESRLDLSKPENNLLFGIVDGYQFDMDALKEIVVYLLKHKTNINQQNELGETALIKAIHAPRMDIARLFIELGTDVNLKDNEDNSPLHLLINCSWQRETFADDVAFFVKHGADLTLKNRDGLTPLELFKTLPFNYIPFYIYAEGLEWEVLHIELVRGREMDRVHWRVMGHGNSKLNTL